MTDGDWRLLAALRRYVDFGGYDGWGPDQLRLQAADRIERLLAACKGMADAARDILANDDPDGKRGQAARTLLTEIGEKWD